MPPTTRNWSSTAFYGLKGTKEKPTGGLFERHFGPGAIDQDGMWAEGAMGYQFMALEALVLDAEVLWHHGIDMYRYRDSRPEAAVRHAAARWRTRT